MKTWLDKEPGPKPPEIVVGPDTKLVLLGRREPKNRRKFEPRCGATPTRGRGDIFDGTGSWDNIVAAYEQ